MSYRRAALGKWKQYNGPRATYRKLIAAFEQAGHKDFAGTVQKVAGKYELCMQYHYVSYLILVALMCLFLFDFRNSTNHHKQTDCNSY